MQIHDVNTINVPPTGENNSSGDCRLTYCMNVHPAGSLVQLIDAIENHAARVMNIVAGETGYKGPFGLGMWLGDDLSRELQSDDAFLRLTDCLARNHLYVFTLNAFPFGVFHGTRVKENVYRPDWSTPERLEYTKRIAKLLARLLPEGIPGTISTLPVTYRSWADPSLIESACENLRSAARYLDELHKSTGAEIRLALEPEPDCLLDETPDAIEFFKTHLHCGRDEPIMREYLGVCLDTTHCGVLGEKPVDALREFHAADIAVLKIQLGAALLADSCSESECGPPDALRAYADEVYLHQTLRISSSEGDEPCSTAQRRFADLPDALAAEIPSGTAQWRVHFHLPLSWPGKAPLSSTTAEIDRQFIHEAMRVGVRHFESEVYTLGVFPEATGREHRILADELIHILGLCR